MEQSSKNKSFIENLFVRLTETLDKRYKWYKFSVPLGLLTLAGLRTKLRATNLYDTDSQTVAQSNADLAAEVPQSSQQGGSYLTKRTPDGTYNDLEAPLMGSANTRFGRNVPIQYTFPDSDPSVLTPSPRTVSLDLLTRDTFKPATTLNLLAAAWLQFMIRDWFSHGKSQKDNPWLIPLKDEDSWPEHPMKIMRTAADPTRQPVESSKPPTYINTETHWWDASQIYGSNKQVQMMVRSGKDGKLKVGADGLIPVDPNNPENPSLQPGFWLGLAMMYNLFTLEHNSICDKLKAEYPSWSDDDLFEHARLINAALLAKIHTVEWTTGILGHPTMQLAMRVNWWGLAEEKIKRLFGRISTSEVISGIPGGEKDHFGVPYCITEEFVAVYKMHPLIPDDYTFRSIENGEVLQEHAFPDLAGPNALTILEQISMQDLLYSFGVSHPGAITLHNYPKHLQDFLRPDGRKMDLAATDIMRSRELGVPRYNQFRRLLHLSPITSFEELTDNPQWREQIRQVYNNDLERVDLTVGMFAETPPPGFGFSDTAFRIFILMASRRLNSDRFFTTDYNARVYTQVGMDWIDQNDMSSVLLRHYPDLGPALRGVKNAFAPWNNVPS